MGRIFGVLRDGRAYLALIHMVFAPALSLFFFVWLISVIPIFNLATVWAAEKALLGSAKQAPASNAGLFVISAALAVAAFLALPLMCAGVLWTVRRLTGARIKVVETLGISKGAFWMMAVYMLV